MAIEPITTNGPTLTVSTAQELRDAYELLSQQDGGGTILLESGDYGKFSIYQYGEIDGDQPVIIASADPEDPAHFTGISLREVSNIRIEDILVDSTENGIVSGAFDLWVKDSSGVQIVDSVFQQDADNALKDDGDVVGYFAHIRDSSDIIFEGNLVDGYFHGLQMTDIENAEVSENEFTNLQGDGFRGGGFQDMLIQGNYFHDFYGVDQNVTHSDLIQLWGANAYTETSGVTITGNILMTSGSASQSIFIRNEEFGDEGDSTSGHFTDFTISNNVIYNAHRWGIQLADIDGAVISNNTLLWNPDATMVLNGTPTSDDPEIYVRNSLNIEARENIAGDITLPDGSVDVDNVIVTYDNPLSSTYVGKHFVNPFAGNDATFADLFLLPSSPWYGVTGSDLNVYAQDITDGVLPVIGMEWAEDDRYEVTYDALQSLDEAGQTADNPDYTYHWTFDDGTTATGIEVTKTYDGGGFKGVELEVRLDGEMVAEVTRNYDVVTKDIFSFDFEDGLVNLGDGDPQVIAKGELTSSEDGQGYLIGDGKTLEMGRSTQQLFELDSFGLALDLTPTGDEQSGTFLELYQTIRADVLQDGRVWMELTTDEGKYSLTSRESVFDDGETHRIGIAFDGDSGQLEMFADGESVSSTEAWGATPSEVYWGLVFGRTFNDSMDAVVDNIEMSIDPSVAGNLPDIEPRPEDPPVDTPPVEEPPAEEPPVEDPPSEEPPAEEPPVENPPSEEPDEDLDTGDRGTPPEAVDSEGSSNFLSDLLDMFLRIFGLGSNKDAPIPESAAAEVSPALDLNELLPVVGVMEDAEPDSEEQDDDDEVLDIAA